MDLVQLYSATQRVVKSIESSGLMPAVKNYRASLHGKGSRAQAQAAVMRASDAYIEKTTLFGDQEKTVINLLHLGQIGTASFWLDLTSDVRSVELRLAQSVSAYSKMMFATNHLPSLLALVRETQAVDGLRSDDPDTGTLILRLYDSVEPASSPDRIARLTDAVDILYSACSSIVEGEVKPLRLVSVTGVAVRSLVFHGDVEAVTATQKVILDLNQVASKSHQDERYSVEAIASDMPFLDTIDKLEQLGVLSSGQAESVARNAQEGAIMLLESGGQLVNYENKPDESDFGVVAKLEADGHTLSTIDSHIDNSIEVQYDSIYHREREKLLQEKTRTDPDAQAANANSSDMARGERSATERSAGERSASERIASKATQKQKAKVAKVRQDNIDDLIIDLNKLYGEQRQSDS